MDEERQERIRYYSFAAFVGALLLLNVTGVWKSIFGIDTAVIDIALGRGDRSHPHVARAFSFASVRFPSSRRPAIAAVKLQVVRAG